MAITWTFEEACNCHTSVFALIKQTHEGYWVIIPSQLLPHSRLVPTTGVEFDTLDKAKEYLDLHEEELYKAM